MAEYTQARSDFKIDWESDSLDEQLAEAMNTFRGMSQAILTFLQAHGYSGTPDDSAAKVSFVEEKFKQAQVPLPDRRTIKGWVCDNKWIKRDSDAAIRLCFAFSLTLEETNDFYRRICLSRGLDCHNYEEAIYYYCLKNSLSYAEAEKFKTAMESTVKQGGKLPADQVLYTNVIRENIDDMEEEEFLAYLLENSKDFSYNNATAYSIIRNLHDHIQNVVIPNEKKYLLTDDDLDREANTKSGKLTDSVEKALSGWETITYILDLNGSIDESKERTLKPILGDNALIHAMAADCFPDRQGLEKVLSGEHLSYEKVRKLLILLGFYDYWGITGISRNGYKDISEEERERFLHILDAQLAEAGYPELYAGNPYDWIFLTCIKDIRPLETLRFYMNELALQKEDAED